MAAPAGTPYRTSATGDNLGVHDNIRGRASHESAATARRRLSNDGVGRC